MDCCVECGSYFGCTCPVEIVEERASSFPRTFSTEITFGEVDPDLIDILTGGSGGVVPPATYAVEIHSPIKLKWWERLLRRPQLWQTVRIPNATLEAKE